MQFGLFRFCAALLFLTGVSSCKIYAPTFKTVENMRFDKLQGNGIKLGADLVFNNPNPVRVRVTDIAADVIVDKKLLGTIGEKSDILIKQRSDFKVPLGITLKLDGSIMDKLKTILGFFADKELDLAIVGNIKLKWFIIKKEVPVKFQTKIKSSQLKGN